MRASPQNIFLAVWIFPLLAPFFIQSEIILHISPVTKAIVIFNIAFFYYLGALYWLGGKTGSEIYVKDALRRIDYIRFEKKIQLLLIIWLAVYFINIVGSGGIPILWILTGDGRTYVDFGLPTFGGLGNMLRAFCLVSCYLLYKYSDLKRNKKIKYLWCGIGLLLSAFVLEIGRGNGVVLLLHPIGLHLLTQRLSVLSVIKWALATIIFLLGLGVIQVVRYDEGIEWLEKYAENAGITNFSGLEMLLIPAITYTAVPIVNTDLNVIKAPFIDFNPNYSLQGIIPTVIRNHLFEKNDYGEIINEANNVSSFYIPLLRDFGIIGAVAVVAFFQLISFFVYSRAMRGNLFCIFIWPALFMSVALSFFSLFFTSLVVVLYPVLTLFTLMGCYSKVNNTSGR
jgi:oligosaccharide repeat unit polymerase